jgi:ferric-dicitrate binding protein FerR (iron transport regulator)
MKLRKLIEYSINSIIKRDNYKQLFEELNESDENKHKTLHIKKAFENYQINQINDSVIDSDFEKLLLKVNRNDRPLYKRLIKYVAIVVLFVGSFVAYQSVFDKGDEIPQITYSKYITGDDENSLVRLNDGTKIYLAENSVLEIPSNFGKANRDVKLLGQAFFDVERNEELPFIINSKGYIVKVLGTKFNVKSYEKEKFVSTTLQQGKVEIDLSNLTKSNNKYILKPNDKFIFNKETSNVEFKQFNESVKVNYNKCEIKFVNKKFKDIVEDLSTFFNVKVDNKYPELNNERFSGRFKTYDDFDEILNTLSQVTEFKLTKKKGKFLITKK